MVQWAALPPFGETLRLQLKPWVAQKESSQLQLMPGKIHSSAATRVLAAFHLAPSFPMFIHEPGCREDEKAASRLLPGVSTWNGTTFPGKPRLSSEQGWCSWECRSSSVALKASKRYPSRPNTEAQGELMKPNLICPAPGWNTTSLGNPAAALWRVCLVPGCSSGHECMNSSKTVPKPKEKGNMDCFHTGLQQSKLLLQATWLTSLFSIGNSRYWRRKIPHVWMEGK